MIVYLKNNILFYVLLASVSLLLMIGLRPHSSLASDGLNKLIQAESLRQSGFTSEELYYPGSRVDPEFRYYPYPSVYHILLPDGRHLGQYPLFYSVLLAALWEVAPMPEAGTVFNLVVFFLFFLLLPYYRFGSRNIPYFLLFGSYLVLLTPDISESMLSCALYMAGFTVLYRSLEDGDTGDLKLFLGGSLAGLSVWLRLEGVLFTGALAGGWLLLNRFRPVWNRKWILWASGFTVLTLLFFLFNQLDYGNVLGPRFMANKSGFFTSILERLEQTLVLLVGGSYKLGYFGFTPLLLVPLAGFFFRGRHRDLEMRDRLLLYSTLLFLFGASFVAPNDGVVTWGPRYLSYAILPSFVLLDRYLNLTRFPGWSRVRRAAVYGLALWSALALVVGLAFLGVAIRQISTFQKTYASVKADHVLFDSSWLASQLGIEYFTRPVYLVETSERLPSFLDSLKRDIPHGTLAVIELKKPECDNGVCDSTYDSVLDESLVFTEKSDTKLFTIRYYDIGRSPENGSN